MSNRYILIIGIPLHLPAEPLIPGTRTDLSNQSSVPLHCFPCNAQFQVKIFVRQVEKGQSPLVVLQHPIPKLQSIATIQTENEITLPPCRQRKLPAVCLHKPSGLRQASNSSLLQLPFFCIPSIYRYTLLIWHEGNEDKREKHVDKLGCSSYALYSCFSSSSLPRGS